MPGAERREKVRGPHRAGGHWVEPIRPALIILDVPMVSQAVPHELGLCSLGAGVSGKAEQGML